MAVAGLCHGRPPKRRRADHVTHRAVQGVQAIVLTLLMVVGLARGTRGGVLGQAATYGLARLATVLISPLAWTHYYVLWLPSVLFVPPWLVRRGNLRAARAVAGVPVGLIWVHATWRSLGLGSSACWV